MKHYIAIGFLGFCLLSLNGCSLPVKVNSDTESHMAQSVNDYDASHYPVTIENYNSKGEKHSYLYRHPPKRVVAVWQDSIETLLALGVGDRIIVGMGVPDKKYIKEEYQEVYDAIPYKSLENLDMEHILMMEPELIVGWNSTFSSKVLRSTEFWESRGINAYISSSSKRRPEGQKLSHEYQKILEMGSIFDRRERAMEIVNQMEREIQFVKERVSSYPKKPRALILEFMGKEIRVYGEQTLAGNIMQELEGQLLSSADSISVEQLIELDPDAIFLVMVEEDYDRQEAILNQVYQHPALQHIKAAREKRVYTVPLYAIYSAGTRAYDGIKIFAQGLYPELYKR